MRFHKFILILLFISFLAVVSVENLDFLKKILSDAASNLNFHGKIIKVNKHLSVIPQKGIYSSVWNARGKRMTYLIRIADTTEINAIVVDVKDNGDYTGDYTKSLVSELHKKNIYAIARIIVFQDNSQIKTRPEWYFKKENGSLWVDRRGWRWMDPGDREVWDYNLGIAKKAIDAGFDELNFDYVRFPVFKKDDDVAFPPQGKVVAKSNVINNFAAYLTSELKKYDPNIALSVDLFAYNMLEKNDLGVGQNFTELYDYFDYVSPMIYPSHYLPGNFGFENPADHPYEVVLKTIDRGKERILEKSSAETGTSTPAVVDPLFKKRLKKLRPWLQDFNIGAIYDVAMIRKEKQAVYDSGLTAGWLLWNPSNVYTESALDR